ncbi:MAG: NACHT domain-containing protein [Haliscomenobacter sp.]|uniref:NACHT domain-containing protein n=1 Tax=Haliscomenobacter sp. TaxID=2717303 RepID=UPI0029B9F75A|nr:NACHT domain-containing protein [Haliscomenobacter sp.]MDX2070380.1 NACHT domain-containing protein [Haliscomenobacter sp.]
MLENLDIDFNGIGWEYVLHTMADATIHKLKSYIHKENKNSSSLDIEDLIALNFDENDLINGLALNAKKSLNWSKEVNFKDLQNPKLTNNIFVHVDFFLTPRRVHHDKEERRIALKKALKVEEYHSIILGGPGAGKTTLLKYLCFNQLKDKSVEKYFICPIVIRLRELNFQLEDMANNNILSMNLAKDLNFKFRYPLPEKFENEEKRKKRELSEDYIEKRELYNNFVSKALLGFLDDFNFLILIDGFDEIPVTTAKESIAKEIQNYAYSLNNSKIVVTSRTGEFEYNLENTKTFEISPLTDSQVKSFISKWFRNKEKQKILFQKIINSPYHDTAMRPLNLAHLCALFERNDDIPEKPKSIYQKIIHLLLEDWNEQRQIKKISRYAGFTNERKIDFLAKLAFVFTTELKKSSFSKHEIEVSYLKICTDFDLPSNEVQMVVNEIESHNGLLIQAGFNRYEFSHKSIQEYLTALYLLNLGIIPANYHMLVEIPEELAIVISLSSNSSVYLYNLIKTRLGIHFFNKNFIVPFFTRLIVEKPDFTNSPYLAITLTNVYYEINYKINPEYRDVINQKLDEIFLNSNIQKSFKKLKDMYGIANRHSFKPNKKTTYSLIQTMQNLEPADYEFPGSIEVDDKILAMIDEGKKKTYSI